MQLAHHSSLIALASLALSSLSSVSAGPITKAVPTCQLDCISKPQTNTFTPSGWVRTKESVCKQEMWDIVADFTPTTKEVFQGHNVRTGQAVADPGSKHAENVGFKVVAVDDGRLSIEPVGKDGKGQEFAVGLRVDQWIYWYDMAGGSSCHSHVGALKDAVKVDYVTVVRE